MSFSALPHDMHLAIMQVGARAHPLL
jgi:hypothetical protein